MIIDAHTHIFSLDTARYPLADLNSTYRPQADGSADLLHQEMARSGVDRALTITAGFYGWDNAYAMDQLVGREDWLAVGTLVDSNVILDVLTEDAVWADWSAAMLAESERAG